MNRYVQLFRMGNALMGAIGVMVASFMVAGTDLLEHWDSLLLSAAIVIVFISGGNTLNDYIDADIDKTAHPERPIPSGRVRRETARNIGYLMLGLSVALSFLSANIVLVTIVAIAAALMLSYELFLKQRGFVGNLTIAVLTGMLFLFGGAVVGDAQGNVIVALMAVSVSIGREISKDIEDREGDEGDRFTLPMRIGDRNAAILASVCYLIGPALSILPILWGSYSQLYYFVLLADVLFVHCAITVFKDAHRAQSNAKKAMILGLLAFILGIIPV